LCFFFFFFFGYLTFYCVFEDRIQKCNKKVIIQRITLPDGRKPSDSRVREGVGSAGKVTRGRRQML